MSRSRFFRPGVECLETRQLPSTSSIVEPLSVPIASDTRTLLTTTLTPSPAPLDTAHWSVTSSSMDPAVINVLQPSTTFTVETLSPDGRLLVTGSNDQHVRVWSTETGTLLLDLTGHSGALRGVAVSPDNATIASVSHDRTARLWDSRTGALLKTIPIGGLGDTVHFSPDGKSLCMSSYGRGIVVVDTATGLIRDLPRDGNDDPGNPVFSPKGDAVTYWLGNTDTLTYSLTENRTLFRVHNDRNAPRVAYDPTGAFFATGTADGFINVWNAQTGKKIGTLDARMDQGAQAHVVSLCFTGTTLLSSNNGHSIYEWDLSKLQSGVLPSVPSRTYNTSSAAQGLQASSTGNTFLGILNPDHSPATIAVFRRKENPAPAPTPVPTPTPALPSSAPATKAAAPNARPASVTDAAPTLTARSTALDLTAQTSALVATALQSPAGKEQQAPILTPFFVTSIEHDGSGSRIVLRFASPYDTSFFEMFDGFESGRRVKSTDLLSHTGGTRDQTVTFANNGGEWPQNVLPIRMWDRPGGTLLQTIYVTPDPSGRHLTINTKQDSFEVQLQQATDAQRQAIAPLLQVETQGPLLFVHVETGSDQSYIEVSRAGQMDALGRGSQEQLTHKGGTRSGYVQLAVPGNTPMNQDLELRLWDKLNGSVLKRVTLRFDGTNVQVMDSAAQHSVAHDDVIAGIAAANAHIRAIQGATLYEKSGFFIDSSQLEQRLAKAFPDVFPANPGAKAEAMHRQNPTYSIGFYQTSLLKQQSTLRAEYTGVLNNYAANVADLLCASVNFWLQIRSGAAERPLYDALMAKVSTTTFGSIGALGIPVPTFVQVLDAGQRLCASQHAMLARTLDDDTALTKALRAAATPPPSPAAPTPTPAAHRKSMKTILETQGTSSPADRLASYLKANPDATPYLSDIAPADVQKTVLAMLNTTSSAIASVVGGATEEQQANLIDQILNDAYSAAGGSTLLAKGVTDTTTYVSAFSSSSNGSTLKILSTGVGQAARLMTQNMACFTSMSPVARESSINAMQSTGEALLQRSQALSPGILKAIATASALIAERKAPIIRAMNAPTLQEQFDILAKANMLQYSAGNGRHPGKLMVLINGYLEHVGEDPQHIGGQAAFESLKDQGYEVINFRVGQAIDPFTLNIEDVYKLTEKIVDSRIMRTGHFENASPVDAVGGYGYSWGGGTLARLVEHEREQGRKLPNGKELPIYAAFIDAVQLGYTDFVIGSPSVTTRPPATAIFNRYEQQGEQSVGVMLRDAFADSISAVEYAKQWKLGSALSSLDSLRSLLAKIPANGEPAHGMKFDQNLINDNQAKILWSYDPVNQKQIPATHINIDDINTTEVDPKEGPISLSQAAVKFLTNHLSQ